MSIFYKLSLSLMFLGGALQANTTTGGSFIENTFAKNINMTNEIEKERKLLNEAVNSEMVGNIALKANLLKKTDEQYMRLGTEKSITSIYIIKDTE